MVVLDAFCLRWPFFFVLAGVLVWAPVPVRVKSDTPSSSALRGVETPRAMLDLGESRWFLELDRARWAWKLPWYTDRDDARWPSLLDFSGVKGEEFRFTGMVR